MVEIELVPSTCWFSNFRSNVRPATWGRIRADVAGRANWLCSLCRRAGARHDRGDPAERGEVAKLGREGDDGRLEVLDVLDAHGRVGRGVGHRRAASRCSQTATARLVMAFSSAAPEAWRS